MKRGFLMIMVLMIALAWAATGEAEGFVLPDTPSQSSSSGSLSNELPDPALYFGDSITQTLSDYTTDGTSFTVFSVDRPIAMGNFQAHWLDDCKETGFSVNEDTVGGEHAWVIKGSKTAYFFPDHDDAALIMIEKGMRLMKALPRSEYVYVTWNGRTSEATSPLQGNKRGVLFNEYSISLNSNSILHGITFTVPSYARDGDTFVSAQALPPTPGVDLFLTESGKLPVMYVDGKTEYGQGFAASSDYYVLTINSLEVAGANTRINGNIRARFLYDSQSLEIDFCVLVPYRSER